MGQGIHILETDAVPPLAEKLCGIYRENHHNAENGDDRNHDEEFDESEGRRDIPPLAPPWQGEKLPPLV
jgi:hypothetical protein